jgi:hypothetical protein
MVDIREGWKEGRKDLKGGRRKDMKGGRTQKEEGHQGRKDTRRDEMINNYLQNVHRIFDSL